MTAVGFACWVTYIKLNEHLSQMTTHCETCKSWLGLQRTHTGDCPVRASAWCSQCGCYGHRSVDCGEKMMWDRPRTLEELIPPDVRERWGIDTQTRILWTKPTLYNAEQEISENNVIELRYKEGKLDNKLREYMKSQRVMTVHKMNDNLQILRNWAISQGKKIRLIQEK